MDLNIIAGLGNYLISTFRKMDSTLLVLDEQEEKEKVIYSWNYDKLEDYLRSKYHYNFINIVDCVEESDEDRIVMRYFDIENNNKDVKVIFIKKNREGYISYTTNKKVKKDRIPLMTDYLQAKRITQYDYMVGYFDAHCSPRSEEFIKSVSMINYYDDGIREILSKDRLFMNALKNNRDQYVRMYEQIMSYPDFMTF